MKIRPTADHVRQAIFDILGDVRDARVLDLFAGTGAMGIEALSRGAREAVFVDRDREACALVLANLEATGTRGNAVIRRADAERWVARKASDPFDLIVIDPPYDRGLPFVAKLLRNVAGHGWLAPSGTVVVEAATGAVEWPAGMRETRVKGFGRTTVSVAVGDA